jgi:tetratricopeptide (TPR) repeat protein
MYEPLDAPCPPPLPSASVPGDDPGESPERSDATPPSQVSVAPPASVGTDGSNPLRELLLLGLCYQQAGQVTEAMTVYQSVLELVPDHIEALGRLGHLAQQVGQHAMAIDLLRKLLGLMPDWAEACVVLGVSLREMNRLDEAQSCYETALRLRPDLAEAHNNLGVVFNDRGEINRARACYERTLALKPDLAEAHNNLGVILMDQHHPVEAADCYRRALALKPDYAEAHNNLGIVLKDQGRFDEALAHYQRAVALKPDYAEAHWNEGLIRLLRGDLALGWRKYEWRWWKRGVEHHGFRHHQWDGGVIAGRTLLVHAEQGIGDSLQFIRYAQPLKRLCARLVVRCPRGLVRLFSAMKTLDAVFAEGDLPPDFDCHTPLLSLPRLFGTTLDTIPCVIPYLYPDPWLAVRWRERLAGQTGVRVGLVWRGNPGHRNDQNRSAPAAAFAPLVGIPGVNAIVLQNDMRPEEREVLSRHGSLWDCGPFLTDWAETAAAISALDLVITVDTAVAHLAGAMGKPAWVLLPALPDWRWLLDRDDSPWYPTLRLFRQRTTGDWETLVALVAQALAVAVIPSDGEKEGGLCPPPPPPGP